jgi:hypothetical protein
VHRPFRTPRPSGLLGLDATADGACSFLPFGNHALSGKVKIGTVWLLAGDVNDILSMHIKPPTQQAVFVVVVSLQGLPARA